MIKERYCSYELSKLLKDKGFDEPCRAYWWDERDVLAFSDFPKTTEDLRYKDSQYLAPTHQMAMDWLRKKGYHIIKITQKNENNKTKRMPDTTVCDIACGVHRIKSVWCDRMVMVAGSDATLGIYRHHHRRRSCGV